MLAEGSITVPNTVVQDVATSNFNKIIFKKKKIFKNCSQFTDSISEVNNTELNNVRDTKVVMPMYTLI